MLWCCTTCMTAYAVNAPRCPQCGGSDYAEEGEPMSKISKHRGVTVEPGEAEIAPLGEVADDGGATNIDINETVKPAEITKPAPKPGPQTFARAGVAQGTGQAHK